MKQFLKKGEVQLVNGGYLSNKDEQPVFNQEFVDAQKQARFVMLFAELSKGKDFVGKKADSIVDVRREAVKLFNQEEKITFVATPEKPKKPMTEKLALEAFSFMAFAGESSKVEKVNNYLASFKAIYEFEKFGLFFEEDIIKLDKIYTMQEITDTVMEIIDLLK